MTAARAAGIVAVCESCGRRPAAGRVVLAGAAPFAVCAECTPATQTHHGIRAVVANTRTPSEVEQPSDPGWQGSVPLPTAPGVIGRRLLELGAAPALALVVWATTGDPTSMVAAGVGAFAALLVLEQRRPRRRG